MDQFNVPCPQCGSVRVVVGGKADLPTTGAPAGDENKAQISLSHRCSCLDCRHTFHHDFSFSS